ncbi:MAG: DNRLRE domain-containing protein [Phycisphaerae bacterium]|nr:DNRLRE domain-containing protein [Phycisphaerae bacterium]
MRHAAVLMGSILMAATSSAAVVSLPPVLDNTLYSSATGNLSNAKGAGLFTGFNSINQNRRSLLKFDVAGAVPAGSTITAVSLQLVNASGFADPHANTIHRVLASWGEGTSVGDGMGAAASPNDATWLHRFYNTVFWSTPGGDFVAAASASTTVGGSGTYTWSSAGLVQDVQLWLNTPASNFGWLVKGGESVTGSSKNFGSREHPDPTKRPVLTITYTPPAPPCTGDWDGNRRVDFADISHVLAHWGAPFIFADITTTLQNWGRPC